MKTENYKDYEKEILSLDDVIDLIEAALEGHKPLSLGRYGHGEIAYLGWREFSDWKNGYDSHGLYAGATAPVETISSALLEALKTTDIVGFHVSWGSAQEDRLAAELTSDLMQKLNIKPKRVCEAFITHDMINSDRFWRALKTRKLAIVGRRASEAREAFGKVGVAVACTMDLEGYDEIEKVYSELSERDDWDAAILAAGIPATILAPMLAQKTNRVVIDFGHALDMLIDGEDFDYEKILARWKEEAQIKIPVSIVMAVYNGEKFIEEAIESALTQSYENIELIIVNDGSTDSTREILDKITDERVKIIHLEQNQGAANALNVGIDNAKGFWIAILDADDIYYPTKIEEQVRYSLTHYGVVGIGTMIDCIPGSKEISKGYLLGVANGKNSYISSHDIRDGIYWGCPLTHSSMMFRKDTFMQVCGYDTDFKIAYDYDLWLKLSEKGELENIPKVLLSYRLHKQSLSNKDNYATVDEIQIVSSRGIYRLLNKGGKVQPKAAVIGPYKAVRNYMDKIAPAAGLEVKAIEYRNWKAKISNVIKEIMTGQTDALIMLDDSRNDNFISLYAKKYLKLNDNFFVIYNILK